MSITPYVLFSNGVCAEAMTRYQEVLGGELEVMRAGDMPPGEENSMPGLTPDSVIHSSLSVDGALLYASDDPTGDGGPMVGMQLAYTAADVEASQRVFSELAEDGTVVMPLESTFFSPAFGLLVDRFGVPWMIDTMPAAE